jgi:hypothetical protein
MDIVVQHLCTCTWVPMETRTYTRVCKRENNIYLKMSSNMACIVEHTFLGLSVVLFISVIHYPCYRSHDFRIIKSFTTFVFHPWFFPGVSTQKYWVLCVYDLVSSFSSAICI